MSRRTAVALSQHKAATWRLGEAVGDVLTPGQRVSRYGDGAGRYVSPDGTPFHLRGMPASQQNLPETLYAVVRPVPVKGGIAAPWAGSPGGAVQYKFFTSLDELVRQGILKVVVP